MIRMRMGGRLAGAMMIAVAITASGVPANAEPDGAMCMLSGRATYDQRITFVSQNFEFIYHGELTGCSAAGDSVPASADVQIGGIYLVDGVAYSLPRGAGHGGCTTSTSSNVAVVDWVDGTRSILAFETASVGALGVLNGHVIEQLEITPASVGDPISLQTTRFAGYAGTGAIGFEGSASDCLIGGNDAGIEGITSLRA